MARNIDHGSVENLMDNARANIAELFRLYQKDELGIRLTEIYDEAPKLPKNVSAAIDIDEFNTEQRAWSNRTIVRYSVFITANIMYYHEEMNERTRKRDVMRVIWRIAQMFMQHVTINGFCPQLGCEVLSADYAPQTIGQKIMAAGMVRIRLHKLHDVVNVD